MSEKVFRPFTINHNDFMDCEFLSCFERVVIEAIKCFARPIFKGSNISKCYPSIASIVKKAKVSESTVHRILKKLKDRGIIKIVSRFMPNKSQTSNEYIIYDFKELWDCEDESKIPELIAELEERERKERIAALQNQEGKSTTPKEVIKPTPVEPKEHIEPTPAEPKTKEKSLMNIADQANGSNNESSPNQNKLYDYSKSYNSFCQEEIVKEIYSMDNLKSIFYRDIVVEMYPTYKDDIDMVLQIIYDTVNTTKPYIRIRGENMPKDIVVAKLLKTDYEAIIHCIDKFKERTNRIRNPIAYMLSILYVANEQYQLDTDNRVRYDMAHTDWTEFYKKRAELQAKQEQEEQEQELQAQEATTTSDSGSGEVDWDRLFREKALKIQQEQETIQKQESREQEQEISSGSSEVRGFSSLSELMQRIKRKRE